MTKNVFKIGAVVLLICMLGAVGVSSVAAHENQNTGTFEVLPADFIWKNDEATKLNWTYVKELGNNPVVMIMAGTTNETFKYLSAFNVTIGGTLKDLDGYKLDNSTDSANFRALVNNTWNVSNTLTFGSNAKDVKDAKQNIFNVSINKAFNGVTPSNDGDLKFMNVLGTSELALINRPSINEVGLDGFLKEILQTNSSDFNLYIREYQPNVTRIGFEDYIPLNEDGVTGGVENTSTIFIYKEHGNVSVQTDKLRTNESFDNTQWSITGATNLDVSAEDKNTDINANDIGWGANDHSRMSDGFADETLKVKVNPSLYDENNGNLVETEATFTVNVSNWNRSKTNNTYPVAAESATGRDGTCWDFTVGLGVNYTVGTAQMKTDVAGGWCSYVTIDPMLNKSGNVVKNWTPSVHYYKVSDGSKITDDTFVINDITAGNKFSSPVNETSKTYFNVTSNNIKDLTGANDVIIRLSGKTLGDADMDDNVDIIDSSMVGISLLRINTESPLISYDDENFIYADCNCPGGNGVIDVGDVLAINKFLVDLDPWL